MKAKNKNIKNTDLEEEQALREVAQGSNKSDYSLTKMSIPYWFCPVVCAGLDMSDDVVIPHSPP